MKKLYPMTILACAFACLLLPGCKTKTKRSMWDDNKHSGNFKNKNSKSFWGNDSSVAANDGLLGPSEEDFIPLSEEDLKSQFADGAIPQPKDSPGEPGSGLPGIDQFKLPSSQLAAIFRNLLFNTDDHILRGKESLQVMDNVAAYLKEHPNTYVFVEGHADERGPEAYNLSLGARRANYVRSHLVSKGVDLNQIHTISYGKERPLDSSHTSQAWTKNRRAQFRIYEKSAK